jgi:hypothetical protein
MPVGSLPGVDEYFCEEEVKQVMMAVGVTVVMLFHKQLFQKGQSAIPNHQASASPSTCW